MSRHAWIARPLGRLALLLIVVVAAPPAARGQEAAGNPGPAADGGFAAHLHAADRTFVAVEDPLPHLHAALNSPALRRAVSQGPLADLLKAAGGEGGADLVAAWDWLNANRRWVPRQVVVGVSDAGMTDVDHLLRAAALLELTRAAARPDQPAPQLREELAALRTALAAEVGQLQIPRFRVYVRFRAAGDAAALLDLVKSELAGVDPKEWPRGLTFDPRDKLLTVRLAAGDLLETDEQARAMLREARVVDPADEGLTARLVAAVRQLRAEASLRLVGDALLLTVGPAEEGGPAGLAAQAAALPPGVGRVGPLSILWARWEARRLKEAGRGWLALREQWRRSAAYALAAADRGDDDDGGGEPVLDAIGTIAAQVAKLADAGSLRVWADPAAAAVRVARLDEQAPAAPTPLPDHPVARFVPAGAEAYSVDAAAGLGESLSDALLQAEDRLAVRSLLAELGPEPGGAGRGGSVDVDGIEAGYYAHFAAFRELVHSAGRGRFEPGCAWVVATTAGRVERVEASFEVDGRSRRWGGRNLPVPEVAIVGRPKGPADGSGGRKFVEDVYAALTTGVRSAARNPADAARPLPPVPAPAAAATIDLGLGVPTYEFDAGWVAAATGEAKLRVDVRGDLRPHFFVADGCLVFSTSPRLSKAMVAARGGAPAADGKPPRLGLAAGLGEGTLVAAGRLPGDTLARAIEDAGAWAAAGADNEAAARRTFDALAQACRLVDRVEWRTTRQPGQSSHLTRGAAHLAADPK